MASFSKKPINELSSVYVGALDNRSIPVAYCNEVNESNSLRFRVVVADGVEMEAVFQVADGVFEFAGNKPTLAEVAAAVQEMYSLVATDKPLKRAVKKGSKPMSCERKAS
ncbi:MAG: hypothetical protein ACSHX0_06770 [Akkermansiaceae bacterium]